MKLKNSKEMSIVERSLRKFDDDMFLSGVGSYNEQLDRINDYFSNVRYYINTGTEVNLALCEEDVELIKNVLIKYNRNLDNEKLTLITDIIES